MDLPIGQEVQVRCKSGLLREKVPMTPSWSCTAWLVMKLSTQVEPVLAATPGFSLLQRRVSRHIYPQSELSGPSSNRPWQELTAEVEGARRNRSLGAAASGAAVTPMSVTSYVDSEQAEQEASSGGATPVIGVTAA